VVVIETMFSHCRLFGLEQSDVSLVFFYAELDGSSALLDWRRMGTRAVGRPRQRWQDVMEDLKKLKVENWKEIAKDRRTWRDLAEKAKTHKEL